MPRTTATSARAPRTVAALMGPALAFALAAAAPAPQPTLEQAVASPSRSPQFVARDAARHPIEELRFFGITPRSKVVEIWPGGGYWTEILAPYLRAQGAYFMAVDVPNGEPEGQNFALGPKFAARLEAHPELYDRVRYAFFGLKHPDLLQPGSVDTVLTFRNLHNWVNQFDADTFLKSIHTALKPGGVLGVEDHRGSMKLPQDPRAKFGYLRQDYAVALVERAGFKLIGSSEINANPRDKADWPAGVWTLPPTYALGDKDRAKYEAVGEADSFVLKFRKTG